MLLLLFYIFIGSFLVFFLKCSFWRRKYSQLMPGMKPGIFDFLADGYKVIFFKHRYPKYSFHNRLMDVMSDLNKIYQKDHLFCFWFFYIPFVILVKSEAVKEVLRGNMTKEKSWVYNFAKPVFGNGLATSPHAIWKPRRKILNHCFHPDILRGFFPIFNENAQKLVQFFRKSEGKDTEIYRAIAACSLDIICEAAFDVKLENLANKESQYAKSVHRCGEMLMEKLWKFWLWLDAIAWIFPDNREAKFHIKVLREFTQKVIREKKERYLSIDRKTEKGKRKALIDVVLQMHLVDNDLTEEEVRHEIDTFALAGHDTVAVTTHWALYLIGVYPYIQSKIHQELDNIFGEDTAREITEDDLNQLHYLDCVIKETLRLYPAVPMFGRQVEEETNICGHTIPKGATCVISNYFLHRDEDVFPDPEKFDPDRFLPENSKNIPEFAYVPFSAGSRNCIGYKFATMEVKILVATVMRNFTIESLVERNKLRLVMQVALHSSSPVYVKLRTRTKKTT